MKIQSLFEPQPIEPQMSDSISFVSRKSFDNTLSEAQNRVVKRQLPQESKQYKKRKGPRQRSQIPKTLKRSTWSEEDQLQYFYAVITFSCTNPYFTLSWEWWKPACFYNYLDSHMVSVFKEKAKNGKQCKTKDQNFKIKYFEKLQQPIDLIDLSLIRLTGYVEQAKIDHKSGIKMGIQVLQRVNRCQEALIEYKKFIYSLRTPKAYEIQQQKLHENSIQIKSQLQQLASILL